MWVALKTRRTERLLGPRPRARAPLPDGSHYRPNHHAVSSQRIYESIEAAEAAAAGHGGRRAEEVRALCRRLHPRLPAFTAEFTQSVPLTRIRDIAHGGDDAQAKSASVDSRPGLGFRV